MVLTTRLPCPEGSRDQGPPDLGPHTGHNPSGVRAGPESGTQISSGEHILGAKLAAPTPHVAGGLGGPVPQNLGPWPGTGWMRQAVKSQDQGSYTLGTEGGPGGVKTLPLEPSSEHALLCPSGRLYSQLFPWPQSRELPSS